MIIKRKDQNRGYVWEQISLSFYVQRSEMEKQLTYFGQFHVLLQIQKLSAIDSLLDKDEDTIVSFLDSPLLFIQQQGHTRDLRPLKFRVQHISW